MDFFRLHGHCNVPTKWLAKPGLPLWIKQQRRAKRDNRLSSEQTSYLEELGFSWTGPDEDWDRMFARLVDYLRPMHNGKPRKGVIDAHLQRWMLTQRQSRKRGELAPERERRLNGISFEWEPLSARWNKALSELKQYQSEHGHCRVPAGWSKNPTLASWVAVQRAKKLEGTLSPDRVDALDALGFTWRIAGQSGPRPPNDAWNTMLKRLADFRAEHGHSVVPQSYAPDHKLGWWVTTQRQRFRRGKLTEDQIVRLDKLAFQWTILPRHGKPRGKLMSLAQPVIEKSSHQEWEAMFVALQEYNSKYGSCLVPQRWKGNRVLAEWVSKQRSAHRRGRLDLDRVKQLDGLDFTWDPVSTWWEKKFQQLLEFKKKHGHTNVPQQSPKYPELATWVHNQRHAKWNNRPIMAEREKRLDEIGFVWRLIEPNIWDRMFERLMEFKEAHGHCNVPQKGGADKKLGRWVNIQRIFYTRGRLRPERQKRLEAVDFVWNMKKAVATKQIGQLDLRLS